MEMEGIHGNAYIISVYCFYHIIGCSKLVDGAVRCTQNSKEIFISAPTLSEDNEDVQLLLL